MIKLSKLIPERPQSEQEIRISGWPSLLEIVSPKQKSQYGDGILAFL